MHGERRETTKNKYKHDKAKQQLWAESLLAFARPPQTKKTRTNNKRLLKCWIVLAIPRQHILTQTSYALHKARASFFSPHPRCGVVRAYTKLFSSPGLLLAQPQSVWSAQPLECPTWVPEVLCVLFLFFFWGGGGYPAAIRSRSVVSKNGSRSSRDLKTTFL